MTTQKTNDPVKRYISRQDLLECRKWGRLAIEQYLGLPDVVKNGEPLYLQKFVETVEKNTAQNELQDEAVEVEFTKIIDGLDVELHLPDGHFFFSFGFLTGMAFQSMLGAGLTESFEGRQVGDAGKEVLLDKLVRSHTNYNLLRETVRESGYSGHKIELYLIGRIKRELTEQYPWLSDVARS